MRIMRRLAAAIILTRVRSANLRLVRLDRVRRFTDIDDLSVDLHFAHIARVAVCGNRLVEVINAADKDRVAHF